LAVSRRLLQSLERGVISVPDGEPAFRDLFARSSCAQRKAALMSLIVGGAETTRVLVNPAAEELTPVRVLSRTISALDPLRSVDEERSSSHMTFFVSWKLTAPRWLRPPNGLRDTSKGNPARRLDNDEVVTVGDLHEHVHLSPHSA
jgi:hypothetical protein